MATKWAFYEKTDEIVGPYLKLKFDFMHGDADIYTEQTRCVKLIDAIVPGQATDKMLNAINDTVTEFGEMILDEVRPNEIRQYLRDQSAMLLKEFGIDFEIPCESDKHAGEGLAIPDISISYVDALGVEMICAPTR